MWQKDDNENAHRDEGISNIGCRHRYLDQRRGLTKQHLLWITELPLNIDTEQVLDDCRVVVWERPLDNQSMLRTVDRMSLVPGAPEHQALMS